MTEYWQHIRAFLARRIRYRITRGGVLFTFAMIVVGVGAIVSANNLLFLIMAAMIATLLVSGLVSRLSGCPIVNLRVDWLALLCLGGRLRLESHFTCCGPRPSRSRRHHVVSLSRPLRKAVAGCAGGCLRETGTSEED